MLGFGVWEGNSSSVESTLEAPAVLVAGSIRAHCHNYEDLDLNVSEEEMT